MARILFLTLVFPPDSVSTAQIMGDLATDLRRLGHSILILTTFPHYNRDRAAEVRQPIHSFWGRILQKSDFGGIPVFHAYMPRKFKSKVLRMVSWVIFHIISFIAGILLIPKIDVIIAPSPPLTIGLVASLLARFHRARCIYNVQELYPDIAIRLGAVKNEWLIRSLFALERSVYRKMEKITVIAPRMRERLLEKGVPENKVLIIPNFVDTSNFQPHPKENDFSRQYLLHHKFVVSYAGNIGPAQGLDAFLEAARLLQNEPRIQFLMLGNGTLRETFRERLSELHLPNFLLLSYQSTSLMSQIYSASNLSLVPQAALTGADAVPSKVYRMMACACPVLAATDAESDLAGLVNDAGCGAVIMPGSSEALAETVMSAFRNQSIWQEMGESGRRHVAQVYARPMLTRRYHDLVQHLVGDSP